MTNPQPKGSDELLIRRDVFNFLLGEGALGGYYFGETRPDIKGAFWWRTALRETSRTPPSVTDEEIVERVLEALTPSGDTKAAYMGEFSFIIMQAQEDEHGEAIECPSKVYVPWTTIKEIMAAIRSRAALQELLPVMEEGGGL